MLRTTYLLRSIAADTMESLCFARSWIMHIGDRRDEWLCVQDTGQLRRAVLSEWYAEAFFEQ